MLFTLDSVEQDAAISSFTKHEFDEVQAKVTLLHQQGAQHTELSSYHCAIHYKLLRLQQAHAATGIDALTSTSNLVY